MCPKGTGPFCVMLVLFAHSWGYIGECQSVSIRRWVMHTAPIWLQLLRDPPQFSLGRL